MLSSLTAVLHFDDFNKPSCFRGHTKELSLTGTQSQSGWIPTSCQKAGIKKVFSNTSWPRE